jgi:hypothetical protein
MDGRDFCGVGRRRLLSVVGKMIDAGVGITGKWM